MLQCTPTSIQRWFLLGSARSTLAKWALRGVRFAMITIAAVSIKYWQIRASVLLYTQLIETKTNNQNPSVKLWHCPQGRTTASHWYTKKSPQNRGSFLLATLYAAAPRNLNASTTTTKKINPSIPIVSALSGLIWSSFLERGGHHTIQAVTPDHLAPSAQLTQSRFSGDPTVTALQLYYLCAYY